METTEEPPCDTVSRLRGVLGEDAVLLPIKPGEKSPQMKNWQETRIEKMSDSRYLQRLRTGNIGVLLGVPSKGLCSIDVDDDKEAVRFLELNPQLKDTLQSRGARGRNFWVRITGEYPKITPLQSQQEGDDGGEPQKWGEWRSTGGQTVIYGRHPSGCEYQIVQEAKPIEISFETIIWPEGLNLPWDLGLYDELVRKEGQPFARLRTGVKLNDCFFVAKFAAENVLLHEPIERQFYDYRAERGLWHKESVDSIKRQFADDLKRYADSQGESSIERKRTNGFLNGLAEMLRGRAEKRDIFTQRKNIVHLANGMLHLEVVPPELREFSPKYYSRNQCPIKLEEGADCPRFKEELLASALDPDDISLFQRWSGSLLLGGNTAQRILLLTGTAGGGKSTLVEIIERIVGLENIAELRTEYLGERFELYRYIGKTLLTGKDVAAGFLMQKGAPTLKKLVGHDSLSPEGKNSNEDFSLRGTFDVVITCNTRLRVKLEGDADAWRRRLMIIEYSRPKPQNRISDFAAKLLQEEANGILLWMIHGAIQHLKELSNSGDYIVTKKQHDRVEVLLAESDSVREFVRTCVKPSAPGDTTTVEEMGQAYSTFCDANDWHPVAPVIVEKQLTGLILEIHGIHGRHDIKRDGGTRRGFKGIECDTTGL